MERNGKGQQQPAPVVVAQRLCDVLLQFPSAAIGGVQWCALVHKYQARYKTQLDLSSLGHSSPLAAATALLFNVLRLVDRQDTDNPVVAVEDAVALTPRPGSIGTWPSMYQALCGIVRSHGLPEVTSCPSQGVPTMRGLLLSQLKPLMQSHWHAHFDESSLGYYPSEEGALVKTRKMKHLVQAILRWRDQRVEWRRTAGAAATVLDDALELRLELVVSKRHNDFMLRLPVESGDDAVCCCCQASSSPTHALVGTRAAAKAARQSMAGACGVASSSMSSGSIGSIGSSGSSSEDGFCQEREQPLQASLIQRPAPQHQSRGNQDPRRLSGPHEPRQAGNHNACQAEFWVPASPPRPDLERELALLRAENAALRSRNVHLACNGLLEETSLQQPMPCAAMEEDRSLDTNDYKPPEVFDDPYEPPPEKHSALLGAPLASPCANRSYAASDVSFGMFSTSCGTPLSTLRSDFEMQSGATSRASMTPVSNFDVQSGSMTPVPAGTLTPAPATLGDKVCALVPMWFSLVPSAASFLGDRCVIPTGIVAQVRSQFESQSTRQ